MAHAMTLTDLTTTFNLSSNVDSMMLGYVPQTPEISLQQAISAIVDGGEVIDARLLNVTESGSFYIVGADKDEVQQNVRIIERLLRQAEQHQRAKGGADPVYVTLQVDAEANSWRSEILSGSVMMTDNVLSEWANVKAEIVITWVRRFYWEGPASYLELYNPDLDSYVTELFILNHSNGTDRNYVEVRGSDVEGSLPAACALEFYNRSGGALAWNNVYIGQGLWIDIDTFDPILEGEDNETGGGTDTANGASSGGYYHALTWGSSSTYSSLRYQFTIDGDQLAAANGSRFRLLARMGASPNSTTYVRAEIASGAVVFARSAEVKLKGSGIEDLGVIQLPPSLSELPSYALADLELNIYARDTVAGSLSIDFIQMTPLDGWRHMKVVGTNFPDDSVIYDDGIQGISYTWEPSGVGAFGNIVGLGRRILVWPERDQKLYFLFDTDTGSVPIDADVSVRLNYRPRRLTI